MATSKTLTPTNVVIQIPDFTEKPDQRVNSNCIDKIADAVNTLNSKITNMDTEDLLANFEGTTSTSVSLSHSASDYRLLLLMVYNSSSELVASAAVTPLYAKNVTVKIYGESNSQWGSMLISNDYASATMNRTTSNTARVRILGMLKK